MSLWDNFTELEIALKLVETAYGPHWYADAGPVRGMGEGFAEPGYFGSEVWVSGNWNDTQPYAKRGQLLTLAESLPVRLGTLLEEIGIELLWSDQWDRCEECHKAIRTEADSYDWLPSYVATEDGYVCKACVTDDLEYWLQELYIGNIDRALTFVRGADLPGDWRQLNGRYESGWHPGQTDTPQQALDQFATELEGMEWLFTISETSQFYMTFELWARPIMLDLSPADAGCYVAGHWGQFALGHFLSGVAYGYLAYVGRQTLADECLQVGDLELGAMLPNPTTTDVERPEPEIVSEIADEAEQAMNDHTPEGLAWGWHDGEFFLMLDCGGEAWADTGCGNDECSCTQMF